MSQSKSRIFFPKFKKELQSRAKEREKTMATSGCCKFGQPQMQISFLVYKYKTFFMNKHF